MVVGIVDSGFDVFNPDLSGNIKYNYNDPIDGIDNDSDGYTDNYYGWDVADSDYTVYASGNPSNGDVHGGPVASIVCGTTNNGQFGSGVGFRCKCIPIKASPDTNNHDITAGYEGIVYAVEHGCQIVNCSWGDTSYSSAEQAIITYAANNHGALVVVAAGNIGDSLHGDSLIYYPASYQGAFSVGGTDSNDCHYYIHNSRVDISAPCLHIYISGTYFGAYDQSPTLWGNGTSDAAPIISGCAAIVKSHFPNMTMQDVGLRLKAKRHTLPDVAGGSVSPA